MESSACSGKKVILTLTPMASLRLKLSSGNLHFGFLLLTLFFPFLLSAQSIFEQVGRLPVTTYTTEEYGGYPTVWASIQSEEGLMYFGTTDGMYEYDGVSWRSLFEVNDFSTIRTFAKDHAGRIFYAGYDFGYLEAEPKGETRAVSLLNLIPEELRSGLVIMSMHFLDGQILLQSPGHIFRLELAEDLALKSLKSWSTETRFSFSFVNEGKYYIQQEERGLFSMEGENIKMIPQTEIFGKDLLNAVLPYEVDGKKFLLLGGRETGFYLFEGGNLKKIPTEIDPLILEGNSLYSAIPHQGNYILSFLGAGIVMMNPRGEIIKRIDSDQGLPSNVVYSIYLDQSEGLWATTEDGMARIAINSPILSFGKDLGISSAVLTFQKKGEELYLGTNTGLVKFDRKENKFKPVAQIDNYALNDLWADGEDLILPGRQLQLLRGGKSH
jgi:hypothetical protein